MIAEDQKVSEELIKKKMSSTTSTGKIKQFTDTLVSQSSLMQKLLNRKGKSKGNNTFRNQLAKKFDKLFNYDEKKEKNQKIKSYKLRHGPKLYVNKPHIVQNKNEYMIYKYDIEDKSYTQHDTSQLK